MAAPTRAEALATLADGQAQLDRLLGELSEDDVARPATIGGGDWSATDLAGHLAFWEELSLAALASWRRGERPLVETIFGEDDGVDRANGADVETKRALAPGEVLSASRTTHLALVDAIESMDDDEWTSKAPYPTEQRNRLAMMLGSVMGAPQRPFGHAFAHLPDLEAYVSSLASQES